jgi:soluble epoxide hydrolase/lipid-phosphate phosphatase
MAKDLCEILDVEGLDRVIALGHDWDSILAQRLYNFYPECIRGLVMLNVAYVPPSGRPLDLDRMLEMMTKAIGYGPFW